MAFDPFNEVLDLEEQFYNEGYQQGLSDGVKAGRIEGRTFGLEKGFEKYVESGKLHGKSLVWINRLKNAQEPTSTPLESQPSGVISHNSTVEPSEEQGSSLTGTTLKLPPLLENQRLSKHVKVLYALAESDSLPTENTEEAVSDFDDRLKRAQAKAKIIERMIGETKADSNIPGTVQSNNDGSIEDVNSIKGGH